YNVCCRPCGISSSKATRIAYAIVFLLFVILARLMLIDQAKIFLLKIKPLTEGFSGVFRVCWAISIYFFTMSIIMIGVKNSKDIRKGFQNGWWSFKILFIFGLLICAFFLPNRFMYAWSIIGAIGASFYILIQIVLLIDFAYCAQAYLIEKWESSESKKWIIVLLSVTFGLFIFSIVITSLMYIYFTDSSSRELSLIFISLNIFLSTFISAISVVPKFQEANIRAGLLQAALITAYSTYLVFSAVSDSGDDELEGCRYNWSFFHWTFALASLYVMMLLTDWDQIAFHTDGTLNLSQGVMGTVWAKVVTSWVALLLYGWTVVAPSVLKNRDFT
ncbi:hypothetical protein Zmor_028536, partial [Zophobas morio]